MTRVDNRKLKSIKVVNFSFINLIISLDAVYADKGKHYEINLYFPFSRSPRSEFINKFAFREDAEKLLSTLAFRVMKKNRYLRYRDVKPFLKNSIEDIEEWAERVH